MRNLFRGNENADGAKGANGGRVPRALSLSPPESDRGNSDTDQPQDDPTTRTYIPDSDRTRKKLSPGAICALSNSLLYIPDI